MFFRCGTLKLLKVKVECRHICFMSPVHFLKEGESSYKEAVKLRTQKLANILNCNVFTAQEMTKKNRNILTLDHHEFQRNAEFCTKHLKLSDIVEFPFVLSFNSSLLQHRYFSLQELGWHYITVNDILKFPYILKQTPKALQDQGFSFSPAYNSDILSQYLSSSERNQLNSALKVLYSNGSKLSKIKETMNAEFLAAKLGCPVGIAQEMLYNYSPLRSQSILNTNLLLNVLFQKLGFSASKVYGSLMLLSLHPEIIEQFLTDIPEVLGVDTKYIAKRSPIVLRKPVSSIQKAERVLKDFSITGAQLMCCPRILVYSPNTIEQRLKALCGSEDFSLLKSYKKFLWLVYYYRNVSERLGDLKTYNKPCSINMFTVTKAKFEEYLLVTESRAHISDVCIYLSEIFDIDEKVILMNLREYPSYQNTTLMNCRKVVDFLFTAGVTKKQLFNGIGIICYDVYVVQKFFENLKNHSSCQPFEEWITHYNLIQLLIYTIEIKSGFRGSWIHKTRTEMDKPQELLAGYSIS